MTTLTLDLHDISHQQIDEFNQTNGVSIQDIIADYVRNLLKKTKQEKAMPLTGLENYSPEEIAHAKALLDNQFGEFSHLVKTPLTVEQMNDGLSQYFAKEWGKA